MANITNDNLTGKDFLVDVGLSEADTALIKQLTDVMGQLLPMVQDTTAALGKVMNTSHEAFSTMRGNMDQHGEAAKKVTGTQLEMRDALAETVKGVDALADSTAKLTKAMEKFSGTAGGAADAAKEVGGAASSAVGSLNPEGRAGSMSPTLGKVGDIAMDVIGKSGKSVIGDFVGGTLGRGAIGSAVEGAATEALGGAGAVAAPILAVLAGYKAWESAVQLQNQYAGAIGKATMGEAVGYEAKARMMALSPFINSEQAHQVVMGTLKAGYTGVEANTVMDFVSKNVKSGVLDINESIGLYKDAVEKAGASTEGITLQLDYLREVAANTSASVEELAKGYAEGVEGLTSAGLPGDAASGLSSVFEAAYAGSHIEDVINPAGMFTNPAGQNALGMILSGGDGTMNSTNFSSEWARRGITTQEAGAAFQGWALKLLADRGIAPGTPASSIEDWRVNNIGDLLVMYGIMTREGATTENVRLWIDWVLSGKGDPGAAYEDQMDTYGPQPLDTELTGATLDMVGGPSGYEGHTAEEYLQDRVNAIGSTSTNFMADAELSGLSYRTMLANGQYLPLVDKWLQSGDADELVIETPDGGTAFLGEYLKGLPDEEARQAFMTRVFSGEVRVSRGNYGHRSLWWDDDDARAESLANPQWVQGNFSGLFGQGADATSFTAGGVTIGFDPVTAKYLRFILPDNYEGLLDLPAYGGPNDKPPPGSGMPHR